MGWFMVWLCSFERENIVWGMMFVMFLLIMSLYLFQKIISTLDHNLSIGHHKRRKVKHNKFKFTFFSHHIWTLDFLPHDEAIFNHTYRIFKWWLMSSAVSYDLIDDLFTSFVVVLKHLKKPPDIALRLLCVISLQLLSCAGRGPDCHLPSSSTRPTWKFFCLF